MAQAQIQDPLGDDLDAFGRYAPDGVVARLLDWTRSAPPGWLGKRRAFFLRGLAVRLLRGQPLDVEALGANMRLYPYNNVCEKRILFTPHYFDEEERLFLKRRLTPDFVFIDIGSNVGGYALYVGAEAGPDARILAIEPQPLIFERLVFNIRQNPFATVKALNCAVADQEGEVTLFIDRRNQGETSMRLMRSGDGGNVVRAPAFGLAQLVAQEGYRHVDAVKLDVEGAEELILEAFFREAPQRLWPRLLLAESAASHWTPALRDMIADYGYSLALRTRSNIAYERR